MNVALGLVGPTASGKTSLSLELARRLRGEIVSLDSRQLYRGMDIGTAKPTLAERARVPHHGLDLVDPGERFSAGRYAREARVWIREIQGRGQVPILVGGTGFFLRALQEPIFREPELDPVQRGALEGVLEGMDPEECLRWVRVLDPGRAERAAAGGGRRLRRTLEVPLLTGRSLSWWHRNSPPEGDPVQVRVVALDAPMEWLTPRIVRRVEEMFDAGFVGEVQRLLDAGFHEGSPGMTGTGYREIAAHLRGGMELGAARSAMIAATRQYARRQRTWFRHQLPDDVLRLDAASPPEVLVAQIIAHWKGSGG